MDHLPTTILEDPEILGRRNTHSILLEMASDMTRMDRAEEKEEGRATEARNKLRCLLALDLLTDRWTLSPSPLISPSNLLSTVQS